MIVLTRKINSNDNISQSIFLDCSTRLKKRIKFTLKNEKKTYLIFNHQQLLRNGDTFSDDTGKEVVSIFSANEKISVITSCDQKLLLRACYHLANRHVLLQIEQKKISYLYDHVLNNMMHTLGLPVSVIKAPFEPEPGVYKYKKSSE